MGIVNSVKKVGESVVRIVKFVVGRLPDSATEPARRIGAWVSKAAAAVTVAYELVVEFTDLVPERYRTEAQVAAGVGFIVIAVLNDIQAELTRDRVTPAPPA